MSEVGADCREVIPSNFLRKDALMTEECDLSESIQSASNTGVKDVQSRRSRCSSRLRDPAESELEGFRSPVHLVQGLLMATRSNEKIQIDAAWTASNWIEEIRRIPHSRVD